MNELITWLRAQLDTDEQIARTALAGPSDDGVWRLRGTVEPDSCVVEGNGFVIYDEGGHGPEQALHIANNDPARVLRQVQAHRAILDEHQPEEGWAHGPGAKMERGPVCGTCARADRFEELVGAAFPCVTLRLLVSIYSDRDGYNPDWSA